MFWQCIIFPILIAVTYFTATKVAVKELGEGEDTLKLSLGLAQTVFSFFIFVIAGEDEVLLEWKEENLAAIYYFVRYAFLLDVLYGFVQVLAVVMKKITGQKGETVECRPDVDLVKTSVASSILQQSDNARSAGVPTGHVPAWKRVQMEEN